MGLAAGMNSKADETLAIALGFGTIANASCSVAMGVNIKTINDTSVPNDGNSFGSCGGCVAMGLESTAIGDWTLATGAMTTARGYASTSMGYKTEAHSFGEVVMGINAEVATYSESK